jgi:hypothetical protein
MAVGLTSCQRKETLQKDQLHKLDEDSVRFIRYNETHALPQLAATSKRSRKKMKLLSFNRNVYIQKPYPREQFKEFLYNLFSLDRKSVV